MDTQIKGNQEIVFLVSNLKIDKKKLKRLRSMKIYNINKWSLLSFHEFSSNNGKAMQV